MVSRIVLFLIIAFCGLGYGYRVLFSLQAEQRSKHRIFEKGVPSTFDAVDYVGDYDGDTFFVGIKNLPAVFGERMPVRVRHIDAAEMKSEDACAKAMALKAKAVAENLLTAAKTITLTSVGRDKYFRLDADVILTTIDNKIISLSDPLLSGGYVVPYDGGTKRKVDWCAMLKKLGK